MSFRIHIYELRNFSTQYFFLAGACQTGLTLEIINHVSFRAPEIGWEIFEFLKNKRFFTWFRMIASLLFAKSFSDDFCLKNKELVVFYTKKWDKPTKSE